MPTRLKRYYQTRHLHFITCIAIIGKPWLASAGGRDLFLRVLEQVRQRFIVVVGYLAMPEHIHLLISEPEMGTPSTVMQVLKQRFAKSVLQTRHRGWPDSQQQLWNDDEPRHIWQARFYDFNVWTEKKRIEKLRHIHRNPVRRGLVSSPEQWPWSSFRWYLCGEPGPVRINDTDILVMRISAPAC